MLPLHGNTTPSYYSLDIELIPSNTEEPGNLQRELCNRDRTETRDHVYMVQTHVYL